MNAHTNIATDPALVEAHALNRAAIEAARPISEHIELHRQRERKAFADIARIAATVTDKTGLIGIDRAKLALAYCLETLGMNSADNIDELETECGFDREFIVDYEDSRDALLREFGINDIAGAMG